MIYYFVPKRETVFLAASISQRIKLSKIIAEIRRAIMEPWRTIRLNGRKTTQTRKKRITDALSPNLCTQKFIHMKSGLMMESALQKLDISVINGSTRVSWSMCIMGIDFFCRVCFL